MSCTLYKQDSKGNIREWTITNKGDSYIVTYGTQGGKKTTSTTVCTPKNVGRSNETSAKEQCILEVDALIDKKLKSGYVNSIESIQSYKKLLKPMLATKIEDVLDENNIDHYVQPKYDGIRCVAYLEEGQIKYMSRSLRQFKPFPHITDKLEPFFKKHPDIILDGELYIHNLDEDERFRHITSVVRKKEHPQTDELQYVVYDTISDGDWTDRMKVVFSYFNQFEYDGTSHDPVSYSPYQHVSTIDKLNEYHQKVVAERYEGTILRDNKAPYKSGSRSKGLIKYKDFFDDEYVVVGVLPYEVSINGKPRTCGKLELRAIGETFTCTCKGTFEYRESIWQNSSDYLGKKAKVVYQRRDSGSLIPIFPVCVGFVDDR